MISVIMASYLGEYEGAASDRERKFLRAIESFQNQTYEDKELIVVADGCQKTKELYPDALFIDRCGSFHGDVRNLGISHAHGDIICYLDSDDMFGHDHLKHIAAQFTGNWVYWDDYVTSNNSLKRFWLRDSQLEWSKIGTSCIAHKKLDVKWTDGYGHDWKFIQDLAKISRPKKIMTDKYIVCHIPKTPVDY